MNRKEYKIDLTEEYFFREKDDEKIGLSNGYIITFYHWQECCEYVYADFDNIELEKAINEKTLFKRISIKPVKGIGFLLNNILINCYNDQNGYYNTDLNLHVINGKGKILIDIDLSKNHQDKGEQL